VFSKISIAHAGRPQSLPPMLAFGTAYVLGAVGTVRFNRLRRRAAGATSP
jgi:hypothetical protein